MFSECQKDFWHSNLTRWKPALLRRIWGRGFYLFASGFQMAKRIQIPGTTKLRAVSIPGTSVNRGATEQASPFQLKATKAEIYAALFSLNAGIQQFLNSLNFLDKSGLGLPFLNGYRILADEIRSAISFSTTETMTAIELCDYRKLEKERTKFSFPPIETLTSESKNRK
jgi:hypothetical protein